MKTDQAKRRKTVTKEIVTAIKQTADIFQTTVETISKTLGTTLKDTRKVGASVTEAIADVASDAILAAVQGGPDRLRHAAKGIMIGVLRTSKAAGAEVMETVRHTAHATVLGAAVLGTELAAVATGLVEGAIAGAKEAGVSIEDAAAAAADGAVKAAGKIGASAEKTVRQAVTAAARRAKVVLKQPPAAKSNKK